MLTAIEGTDLHTIHENLCIVVRLGHAKHAGGNILVEGVAIDDATPTLVELLHRLQSAGDLGSWKVVENGSHLGELHLGNGDGGDGSRYLGLLLSVHILAHHRAQLVVFGRSLTSLVDGGIIVVAGHVGSKARTVGTGPVSPVGATMGHIEREGDALRKHFVKTFDHILGSTCLMLATPLVEPSAPELRAHLGSIGTQFAKTAELVVDVSTRAEVHRPDEVIETIVGEVARPVALEQLHLVETDFAQGVTYGTHVRLVDTIRTIFVLDLHHDDGTSLVDSEIGDLLGHLRLEDLQALHKIGVELTQTDVLLLEQPPWQTTHLPFGTNIGTRTQDDVHPVLLSQLNEGAKVVVLGEVEHSFLLFMDVPENIKAQRVHAECLAHLDTMFPIGTGDARIMNLSSLDNKWFAIEEEGSLAGLECARCSLHFLRCTRSLCRHSRSKQTCNKQQ